MRFDRVATVMRKRLSSSLRYSRTVMFEFTEEPYEGNLHVRVCGGRREQSRLLPGNGSGPLRSTKGSLYEGGLRVPFIARWPGRIDPGTVSHLVSGFQDMMPTFAEMAGVDLSVPTDGLSMLPTLLGRGRQATHEFLYWELNGRFAMRMGRWKAVVDKKGTLELYDLAEDLGEARNVAAGHPELVQRIKGFMTASHTETPWTTWKYTGPG